MKRNSHKIITFSNLHLEFMVDFRLPKDISADVMVLSRFLEGLRRPVIFIAGNHEFYNKNTMQDETEKFQKWIVKAQPNLYFLQDLPITINKIYFFLHHVDRFFERIRKGGN